VADWGLSVVARTTSLIVLSGELDMQSAPAFERELAGSLAADGPVVIDVSDLRFIDSTGIRTIVAAAEGRRGCVILHGARGGVANVFEIADLDGVDGVHVEPCARPSTAS
jgi:anti-sigma B factor antagonist